MMSKINFLFISDVHYGHPRTETQHIINSMDTFIYQLDKPVDMIVFPGDLFDRGLALSSQSAYLIITWFVKLLNYCKSHSIGIRILEGTPSHDRKQGKFLSQLFTNEEYKTCDFKYIDTLMIEYHVNYNLNFLYIPDEYNPSTEKTFEDVKELLREKDLSQVDFVFMHGQFTWQLPPHVHAPKHEETNYDQIAKHNIICGHVHTHSHWKNKIVIPGSFERLQFGEEENKGGIYLTLTNNKTKWEFIENKTAKVYISINVKPNWNTIDLRNSLLSISTNASIRFVITKDHQLSNELSNILAELRKEFSALTIKLLKKDSKVPLIVKKVTKTFDVFEITQDNIQLLLEKETNEPLSDYQISLIKEINNGLE